MGVLKSSQLNQEEISPSHQITIFGQIFQHLLILSQSIYYDNISSSSELGVTLQLLWSLLNASYPVNININMGNSCILSYFFLFPSEWNVLTMSCSAFKYYHCTHRTWDLFAFTLLFLQWISFTVGILNKRSLIFYIGFKLKLNCISYQFGIN